MGAIPMNGGPPSNPEIEKFISKRGASAAAEPRTEESQGHLKVLRA